MRAISVALIVVGIALIVFGVVDHYVAFVPIPFEMYIFGVIGFIIAVVGGVMSTMSEEPVPAPPDPESERPMIVE
jgi:hypothetical protein